MKTRSTIVIAAFIATAFIMIQCSKPVETSTMTPAVESSTIIAGEKSLLDEEGVEGVEEIIECIYTCVNAMPVEELSASEIETLNFVREEEYLARDVYLAMYDMYGLPIFNNISSSEDIHSTTIKALIEKYGLNDPGANHVQGIFEDEEIQVFYNLLVEQGSQSLQDALIVGETIEDLDIADLIDHIENDVDNADILYVLNQLYRGSRNHLRAFYGQLNFHNLSYVPQYISQELYDEIVGSDWEVGNGFCVCNFNISNTEQRINVR